MSTRYNTGNPIESTDVRDMSDNAKNFDEFSNSMSDSFTDRFGEERQTIDGSIRKAGFQPASFDFVTGGTIVSGDRNKAVFNPEPSGDNNWYAWQGLLPKVVPAGSTPSTTGGLGENLWKPVTNNILAQTVRESIRRSYAEAGYNLVAGSFRVGFTLANKNDVALDESSGKAFSGVAGTYPAGTSTTGFVDESGKLSISSTQRVENFPTLQAAVDFAVANEIKVMRVDTAITSGDITKKGSVSFIGNGSISGVYRKRVARDSDPVSVSFNNMNPEVHLSRFLSKKSPVVVVVGDSIATETGANVPTSDSLYSRLCNKLSAAYPDKAISFYNRAIGGETYFSSVGLPSSFPIWYTDTSRSWLRYVGDLNPDLVIFNFGMNDGSNLHNNVLTEYMAYMNNVALFPAGKPDVVYCTNLTPSIDTTFSTYWTEAGQSGRDHVAGFTRSFAKSVGAGLLDFHRQCTIVKDGYDPTDTHLEKIGAVTPVNGSVASTQKCTDFKWELTLSLPTGSNLAVRLGSPSDSAIDPYGRGSYVVIANQGGLFKCDFFYAIAGNGASVYGSLPAGGSVPTGSFILTVEKKQNTFLMSVGGVQVARYDKLRVGGADVQARAGDGTYTSGTITSAVFWCGRYKTYKQSITNDDMWGQSDNQAIQRQPYGGNGANHPSTIGCAAVFQPVIDMTDFSSTADKTDTITPINGWRSVSSVNPSRCVRAGKAVTVSFFAQVPVTGTPAKGVIFNVPEQYRPPAGISVYGVTQNSNSSNANVTCTLSSNGNIEVFANVDQFIWGTISFVLS